ncbi:tetratricopeptide repeat protein [Nocardioides sp. GY 10127]|uniref:tetratricopeptide repeat protein n=1 Tax=Nocardioides sp. GY 10127 TaxID=2569762 RepID=UPI0010A8D52E|nr:tetratricopeptide repeat protein [Nocardioides sp. GY 10127]TIC85726.1 tetratricopeptide repeat protein [Nocardioides sp. GY 10127]
MAENRRPSNGDRKPSGRGYGSSSGRSGGSGRPSRDSRGSSSEGRSSGGGRGASSDYRGGKPDSRGGKPDSRGGKPGGRSSGSFDDRGKRGGGRPFREERAGDEDRPKRTPEEQARYDGPEFPEGITGRELDRSVAAQLKGLPEKVSARVARHLAAAGALIESDPETAYGHAVAAKLRAPRLAVVREAAGEAAYAAGHYAEALADLRAAKRMNGATDYLPIMADCHRALGQADQALKLAKSPSVANFAAPAKAEMTIVEAGARRDLGQIDAALRTLELAPLQSKSREAWVVRLRYAYADALVEAGRPADALAWFHRTYAIDADQLTDAAERAAELEKNGASDSQG